MVRCVAYFRIIGQYLGSMSPLGASNDNVKFNAVSSCRRRRSMLKSMSASDRSVPYSRSVTVRRKLSEVVGN